MTPEEQSFVDGIVARLKSVSAELADRVAGIPRHSHTGSDGKVWGCASPYCGPEYTMPGSIFDGPPCTVGGVPAEYAKHYRRD